MDEGAGGGAAAEEELARGMQWDGLLFVVCGHAESVKAKVKMRTVDLTLVSRRRHVLTKVLCSAGDR